MYVLWCIMHSAFSYFTWNTAKPRYDGVGYDKNCKYSLIFFYERLTQFCSNKICSISLLS